MEKNAKMPNGDPKPVVEVLDYNEKCFGVFGDHKPMAQEFRKLRGLFNARLTHPVTGEKPVMGWLFNHYKRDKVEAVIKKFT